MILGVAFLLGGTAFLIVALRRLRGAGDADWVRSAATRLVVAAGDGQDAPRATLWRGDGVAFGPCPAAWDPPQGTAGVPAPMTGSGDYRVVGAVDLSAVDAFAAGDPRLAKLVSQALGSSALVLRPVAGDRPVLLHGTARGARDSAAGIGISQTDLDALMRVLGDPTGLRVQVVRRRVQRAGWGRAQSQRHRGRQ